VVANIDYVTSDHNRDLLIDRLIELGQTQTVVTATVNGVVGHPVYAQLQVDNTERAEITARKGGE